MLNIEKLTEVLKAEGLESEQITIVKNNVPCTGIRVINPDTPSVSPIIYYNEQETLESFLFKIHAVLSFGNPQIDISRLTNLEYVKENLILGVQKLSNNTTLVKKQVLNLEVFMKITLDLKNTNDIGTCKLNRELQQHLKIAEQELWEIAYKNTYQNFSIRSMYEMCGIPNSDDSIMYVVTSADQNAATALCFPDLFKKFCAEKGESGCYILPSSTEELIIIPASAVECNGMCSTNLAFLVNTVNVEMVEPQIQLDPVVYYYNIHSNIIQISATYQEE